MAVGPTVRVRLLVAYDGPGFHGFALQPGVPTVGGVLAAALERHLRHTVELTCAGRTDAGVHAWGQVVSFDARADVDPTAVQRSLNRALRPAVVVRRPRWPRRASTPGGRRPAGVYRYTVRNHPVADPFTAGTAWHVPQPLDLAAMRLACDPLYRRARLLLVLPAARPTAARWCGGCGTPAGWISADGMLRFEIEASSFCQQMVRSIVGTLVEVGLGKRRAGEMATVVRSGSRSAAGQLAPAHGLCLWAVHYP